MMRRLIYVTLIFMLLVKVGITANASSPNKQFNTTIDGVLNEDIPLTVGADKPAYVKITTPHSALITISVNGITQKDIVLYKPDNNAVEGYFQVDSVPGCNYIYLSPNTTYYYQIPTSEGQIILRFDDLLQTAVTIDEMVNDTLVPGFRQVYKYRCQKSSKYAYNTPELMFDKATANVSVVLLDDHGHYGFRKSNGLYYGNLFCTGRKNEYIYVLVEPISLIEPTSFSLNLSKIDKDDWGVKIQKKAGNKLVVKLPTSDKNTTYSVLVAKNKKMTTKLKKFTCDGTQFTKKLKSGTYYVQVERNNQVLKKKKIKIK